ncbi:glyoxal reductase-like isoform X2 [Gigantopelta aegis]|uniref:glyoxal reductase-like isoform X2 n=1 Tax=Gigantopelta aegis TaxID=1735272 RepID=UPI001B889D3E|nr:glyoxal reductase-like isoform X2 [Gigantopelta aegis]
MLGTYKIQGANTVQECLDTALSAGYRSIDTASVYKNEEDIGASLKHLLPKHGLKREDIFVTSKLSPRHHGTGTCYEACLDSLRRLQMDYLDLYLIHWPGVQSMKPDDVRQRDLRKQSWHDMEKLYNEGKLHSIGISNYVEHHIRELLGYAAVKPAALQIECHPHTNQAQLAALCKSHGIHFQAYSSLGGGLDNMLIDLPVIQSIAESYKKSTAQVLLRWAIQQGYGVLPKSIHPARIKENIDIFDFELSEKDMDTLNKLNSEHHYAWNPVNIV